MLYTESTGALVECSWPGQANLHYKLPYVIWLASNELANEDVWDRKHHAKGIEQFVDTQVDLVTEAMHMSNSFTG